MKSDLLDSRAQRLGVLCDGLSERQTKEAMVARLLQEHRPEDAGQIIAVLPKTLDAIIDELLQTLETENAVDWADRRFRSEDKLSRFNKIVTLMKEQNLSAPKAARQVLTLGSSAVVFRQLQKLVRDLEKIREKHESEILWRHVQQYKPDTAAMQLWETFIRARGVLRCEYGACDFEVIVNANRQLDQVFANGHPFALGLVLLFAPVGNVWCYFGRFFERIEDDGYRRELFGSAGKEPMTAQQAADAALDLLRMFGSFTSASKKRRN